MSATERTPTVPDYLELSSVFTDPAQAAETQAEQLEKAEVLEQAIRDATGNATSPDDRIRVSWSESGGIDELVIDPRAMRQDSDELAAQIAGVVNAARAGSSACCRACRRLVRGRGAGST